MAGYHRYGFGELSGDSAHRGLAVLQRLLQLSVWLWRYRYGKGRGGMVRAWMVGMAWLQVVTSVKGGPAGRADAAAATGYAVL